MKKLLLIYIALACLCTTARAEAFPIDAAMNGAERSYDLELQAGVAVYTIDMGFPGAFNETALSIETVHALMENGIDTVEIHLPWITGRLNLAGLTIPERNETLRLSLQRIEPVGDMRVKWRAYRPGKLVDPFEIGFSADFTPDILPEGMAGIVHPDPEPPYGNAFGFAVEIRYPYGKERLRVLRWNGENFVDIPGARWEVVSQSEKTYVHVSDMQSGVYTVIDAKAVNII